MTVLTLRQLNRATLDRQHLLRRADRTVSDLLEHLVGLQAQTPHTWYVGLWSRLAGFSPEEASRLLGEGDIVRLALMRSTIHLVTAEDAQWLRPAVQPMQDRGFRSAYGRQVEGLDPAEVERAGRAALAERPLTFSALGRALAEHGRRSGWGEREPQALANLVRTRVALVQVPPRGQWGRSGAAAHTPIETWPGRALAPEPSVARLVLRYLAAFGPASVRDVQHWSGLTRLAEEVDGLRGGLRVYIGPDGRELFDLPDVPLPDPDTPAPVRFCYEYDNVLRSHADTSRLVAVRLRDHGFNAKNGVDPGTVLVDGMVAAGWRIALERGAATLAVTPVRALTAAEEEAVCAEGAALLEFWAPKAAERRVEVAAPTG
ncbi:winged helix DNA-binding domain-containing protein [Streptomonospora sp. S1-112]|uniref:Winged helix DNA-binding domain-containing protein n=1 Tax=Streptomonospora mangrovi TaxID=2883123 RepID=A0A9X3SMK5_9ACTN|nr:winged helix DNA-binding domain-containing protein [Streptomonospora mangrovi]MDA0564356.1 winged helix DNA-binding domain-containing protein [Streptomonospora mangrovi]